jgi:carbon monoxide dehydrogenase subunit G
MMIEKSREISADTSTVWKILVDWDNERKYWSNQRDIKVLTSNETAIEREATVGPRAFAQRTKQKIVLDPKKSIKLSLQGDHLNGERTISLSPASETTTRLDVAWNLQMSDVPGFVEGIVKSQISKVTEDALKRISEAAQQSMRDL